MRKKTDLITSSYIYYLPSNTNHISDNSKRAKEIQRGTLRERENQYNEKNLKATVKKGDEAFSVVCPSDKKCSSETVRSAFPVNEGLK